MDIIKKVKEVFVKKKKVDYKETVDQKIKS